MILNCRRMLIRTQAAKRMELWKTLEQKFFEHRNGTSFDAHNALYRKAAEMMRPEVRAAFDLTGEPDKVRRRYGTGIFGQGCLLARRLVERGVPFVEVALGDGLVGTRIKTIFDGSSSYRLN